MIKLTFDQFTNMTHQENYYVDGDDKEGLVLNKNFDQTHYEVKRIHIFSSEHEYLYTKALKIFSKNILFGVGTKNFRTHCSKYFYNVITPDNDKAHFDHFHFDNGYGRKCF